MERIERFEPLKNTSRNRNVGHLVDSVVYRKDSELSYYIMLLHDEELDPIAKVELVKVIANDKTDRGIEMAFRLLRDQHNLDQNFREALLGRIVASADKTTCSLTLQLVPQLGEWEGKLRNVLSG